MQEYTLDEVLVNGRAGVGRTPGCRRRATRPEGAGGALLPSGAVRVSDFEFELPPELVAQHPAPRRRDSRLLVLDAASAAVSHRRFPDLVEYLMPADVVVVNDTRVIRGRCFAAKPTGGRVEILVERILAPDRVLAWLRAGRTPGCGVLLSVDRDHGFVVRSRRGELFELEFAGAGGVAQFLERAGAVPPNAHTSSSSEERGRWKLVTSTSTQRKVYPG